MTNRDKLKELFMEVFLISSSEFRFDLKREEVDTWDSLGVVSLAVGIEETFGYHLAQDEALAIRGVGDIMQVLESKGISFHD
jgi:acyl carrier protein